MPSRPRSPLAAVCVVRSRNGVACVHAVLERPDEAALLDHELHGGVGRILHERQRLDETGHVGDEAEAAPAAGDAAHWQQQRAAGSGDGRRPGGAAPGVKRGERRSR